MKHTTLFLILIAIAQANTSLANPLREALLACHEIADKDERYGCYEDIDPDGAMVAEAQDVEVKQAKVAPAKHQQTYLERKWHLKKNEPHGFLDFETHEQNYIVTTVASDINNQPDTPNQPATANRDLQNKDWQFQISIKNQFIDDIGVIRRNVPWIESARLWGAYTQKSFWQIYNGGESRKFRETNYAPELILSLGLDETRHRLMPNMVNFGFVHESNGRDNPISRSWNRLYLQSAWELGSNFTVIAKPWWRVHEKNESDDNPDLSKFLGYGDLTFRWDDPYKKASASLLLRNNLRGNNNKGYARLNVSYAPSDFHSVRLFMMLSSGYGESLVDYNFKQTVFGLGFAIGE